MTNLRRGAENASKEAWCFPGETDCPDHQRHHSVGSLSTRTCAVCSRFLCLSARASQNSTSRRFRETTPCAMIPARLDDPRRTTGDLPKACFSLQNDGFPMSRQDPGRDADESVDRCPMRIAARGLHTAKCVVIVRRRKSGGIGTFDKGSLLVVIIDSQL